MLALWQILSLAATEAEAPTDNRAEEAAMWTDGTAQTEDPISEIHHNDSENHNALAKIEHDRQFFISNAKSSLSAA